MQPKTPCAEGCSHPDHHFSSVPPPRETRHFLPLRCGPGYCVVPGANLHCNHPAGSVVCPAFSYMP